MLRHTLLTLLFALIGHSATATHMSGGEIYWECLGNNQYRIRLLVYRDCAGIEVDPSYNLVLTSPCGNRNLTVTTNGGVELSQLCDLELPNSTCNGGTLPGIQQYTYTGVVTLPPCDSWRISWTNIYRNNAIVNLTAPGTRQMYIESVLNNSSGPCNDSPTFSNAAIPYVCLGYPISYSYGAVDAEADSLSYSLIGARMLNGAPIPYVAPFTPAQPIPGITLDPVTGLINFTLSIAGNWVVAVLVTEYDDNGNVIGQIMRDMQFVAYPCSNIPPDPATGLVSDMTGTAVQVGPRAVDVCESGDFCFNMVISDANANNILTATSNVQQNLPGATFTYTGTNPITAQVCWTAQPGTSGFFPFIVNVNDGACPISAFQTYVYSVRVIPGLAANIQVTPESCAGLANGTAQVVVTTGTGPFTYAWSNGATGASITAGPGTYTVNVNDDNGCVSPTLSGTITAGSAPNQANAGADIDACAFDGAIPLQGTVVNATGGAWSSPTGTFSGTWPNISYLPATGSAGSTVEVTLTSTGNGNCPPATDVVAITLHNSFAGLGVNSTPATCNGSATGSATVAPNNPSLTYLWSDPGAQTTATATLLAAGNYSVLVSDAFGCDTTLNVTVGQATALTLANLTSTPENCAGTADGSLTASASGGTAPYTYTWNTGASGPSITTGAGNYTVSVTDANGCAPVTASVTIGTAAQPNVADAGADLIACMNTYPITVQGTVQNATGGTWSGGSGTITGTGLTIQYTPTISEVQNGGVDLMLNTTGNSNCPTAQDVVHITLSNSFLDAALTPSDASCNNSADGSIAYSPIASGLSYVWSDQLAQSTPVAVDLLAGTYSVVVTDDLGCDTTLSATIAEPSALVVGTPTISDVDCAMAANGSVVVDVQGGTPGYSIAWSNGQTGPSIGGLAPGTYSAQITDAQGCSAEVSATVDSPEPIQLAVQAPDTVCVNTPVQLIATASGGAGGYQYNWGGLGYNDTIQLAFSTAQTVLLTVVDQAGCAGPTVQVPIAVLDINTGTLSTYGDTTVCNGGVASVGALFSGYSAPVTYSWSPLGYNGPGPFSVPITADQDLQVTVMDACGSSIIGMIALRTDTPPAIQLSPIIAQGCAPLQVQFPTLNLGNVMYSWNLGNGNTTNVPSPQVTYGPGNFTASLTVTTSLGCTASSSGGGQIIAYASPTAAFTASTWSTNIDAAVITFTDQSQGSISSYDWVFGDGGTSTAMSPTYEFNDIGTFDVDLFVEDVNGCTATVSHPVTIEPVYDVVIPTAFTPNPNGPGGSGGAGGSGGGNWVTGDLSNDVFYPFVRFVDDFRMRVFNRWGELVFESTDLAIGWDGYYRGELSPQDVYVVQTWFRFVDGKQVEKLSDLTLFR